MNDNHMHWQIMLDFFPEIDYICCAPQYFGGIYERF